jgi:hypothetical protein
MLHAIQIVTTLLVALAMAPAVAHAFEYPGKRRLDRDRYVAVQAIYYPGFTLLGITEPGALIAIAVLLLLTPRQSAAFLLTVFALACVLGMQVVYWIFTHPTNRYWLQSADAAVGKTGTRFFAAGSAADAAEWTKFRDRWEYSHIARAGLSFLSFVLITLAIVLFN